MEDWVPIRISNWLGLNSRESDLEIKDGETPSLKNIEFFKQGFAVRNGITKVNATAIGSTPVTGLFDGFNHVLAYSGTKVYRLSAGAWVEIASALANNAIPQFVSYNALDIMVNGSANDAPQKWDGTTWAALGGSPPKADSIEVWRNHVWLAGLASPNQGEVRHSALEDPESNWSNFLRPAKRTKGHELIAVKACPYPGVEDGTRLVAFAADAIFQFDGFTKSLFQIYTSKPNLGCISARSIVVTDDLTYWIDENGIYCSPDAGQTVNQISWNIQPTFDGLNKARLQYCVGTHFRYKRQIWWSFSDGASSTHDLILVYNYGLSTPLVPAQDEGARHVWGRYTGVNLMSMAEILSSGEYLVYGGDSASTGFAYQLDKGTDDAGTAISWSLKTKRFLPQGTWSRHNVMRKATIIHDALSAATATMKLYQNAEQVAAEEIAMDLAGAGGGVFDQAVFDTAVFGGGAALPNSTDFNRMLAAFQLEILGNQLGKLPRIYEITAELRPLRGSR